MNLLSRAERVRIIEVFLKKIYENFVDREVAGTVRFDCNSFCCF